MNYHIGTSIMPLSLFAGEYKPKFHLKYHRLKTSFTMDVLNENVNDGNQGT